MSKTNCEVFEETLALADAFYESHGYISRIGFRYDKSSHPQERFMWQLACIAQDLLCDTDAQNALDELEDEDHE
jgi:hypothetical protein